MRLTRIHVDAPLAPGQRLPLPDPAARHLLRVLRLGEDAACVLFNGDGHDYRARIVAADKRGGEVEIIGVETNYSESPLQLWLVQSIARGEKMDFIVQKATELGASAIIPVVSERSEVKLDGARADKRLAHWRSVILAACEQSGRARIPMLHAPQSLAQLNAVLPAHSIRHWLDPEAAVSLANTQIPPATPVVLAIGPEGGFSPRDGHSLIAAGFTGTRLGPRILRTETAGLAALAILQARYGDI